MQGRVTRRVLGTMLVALTLTGCMNDARREIEADRVKAHAEPLDLNGPEGTPVAHIGTDGNLVVGDKAVALDAAQQAATLAYREAALKVVDVSMIGAEKYVRTAVPRFLFDSVLHMGTDGGAGAWRRGRKGWFVLQGSATHWTTCARSRVPWWPKCPSSAPIPA
ncbi:MAG: hypothetical protein B7X33_04910 [Lysobacterales bacterium 13-68-4]|nr:MAG: hypothetical protein B7X33_04910 [Xanthomonadales bacterium 13-68-4]